MCVCGRGMDGWDGGRVVSSQQDVAFARSRPRGRKKREAEGSSWNREGQRVNKTTLVVLEQSEFARCVFWPRRRANQFITDPNSHAWKWSEKLAVIDRLKVWYWLDIRVKSARFHTVSWKVTKRLRKQFKKEGQREKLKSLFLPHFCTAGQSQREVFVNVRLLVSESCRNGWTQPPILSLRGVEGGGFQSCSTIRQALLLKHTGQI